MKSANVKPYRAYFYFRLRRLKSLKHGQNYKKLIRLVSQFFLKEEDQKNIKSINIVSNLVFCHIILYTQIQILCHSLMISFSVYSLFNCFYLPGTWSLATKAALLAYGSDHRIYISLGHGSLITWLTDLLTLLSPMLKKKWSVIWAFLFYLGLYRLYTLTEIYN